MRRRSIASEGRPPDLLAEPPSVRIQYFKDFAIAHPLLVEAKDRLLEAIMESAPNSIVIVLGPTGVGKTTLLAKIRQLLGATAARRGTSGVWAFGGRSHGGDATRIPHFQLAKSLQTNTIGDERPTR